MSLDLIVALGVFAAVMAGTPGPNNMMVLTSGVNFGFRRTLPHMLGIALGFGMMNVLVGLGLGQVFALWPSIYTALKLIGSLYLLWLAWGIARAGEIEAGAGGSVPLTFLEAAMFQWVNPKAWVIAVGAVAAYALPERYVASIATIGIVMAIVTLPCVMVWTAFGAALRTVLSNPGHLKAFNRAMALLLVASLWPIVADLLPK